MPNKQIRSEKTEKQRKIKKRVQLFVNCLECANNGILDIGDCLNIATIMRKRSIPFQNAVKIDREIAARNTARCHRLIAIHAAEDRADAARTQPNHS